MSNEIKIQKGKTIKHTAWKIVNGNVEYTEIPIIDIDYEIVEPKLLTDKPKQGNQLKPK